MSDFTMKEFADRDDQAAALAGDIADSLKRALKNRGTAAIAVSGGRTPVAMFDELSQYPLDWQSVCITLVDERWVPTEHEDSNERLLREHLLRNAAAAATFCGLKSAHEAPEAGEATARQRLRSLSWPLDIVHLGMGADGHTASWFADAPEYPTLAETRKMVMALHPASQPQARMTLTPKSLFKSRHIILQIAGDEKRRILEAAAGGDIQLPVSRVLQQRRTPVTVYWAP